RGNERAHRTAAVAVDLDPVRLELCERADVREPARAAAGEDDPQGAPDEPSSEPAGSGVAWLGRREAVVGARLDAVEEGAEGVARGRAEEDKIGLRARGGRPGAVGRARRAPH